MARVVVIALLAGGLSACASSGAVYTPQPFPTPGGKRGTTAIPAPGDPAASPGAAPPVAANPPVVPPGMAPPPSTPAAKPPLVAPGRGTAEGYALSGTALSLRGAPYRNGGI